MKSTWYVIISFAVLTSIFSTAHSVLASSSIRITEIMYDVEGADTNKEWIEIHNTGSTSIPIGTWFLFENNVNHRLTPLNFENLEANERAVIIQNEIAFTEIYGSSIKIIKSSFSLHNEGETIEIRNSDKVTVDTVTYSREVGGAGDGTTYGLLGSRFSMTAPTPGQENKAGQPNTDGSENTGSESESDSNGNEQEISDSSDSFVIPKKPTVEFQEYYQPYINFESAIVAKNPSRFRIGVFHVQEKKAIQALRGWYYVNFGDGTSIQTNERIDLVHSYPHAGTYLITFEYYASKLSMEAREDPDVLYQKKISVLGEQISIIGMNEYGVITIENTANKNINLERFEIRLPHRSYTFPKYSIIEAKGNVHLSQKTLGFSISKNELSQIKIFNTEGILVGRYENNSKDLDNVTMKSATAVNTMENESLNLKKENTENSHHEIFLGPNTSFLEEYIEKNSSSDIVSFTGEVDKETEKDQYKIPSEALFITGGSLLALGLGFIKILEYKKEKGDIAPSLKDNSSL